MYSTNYFHSWFQVLEDQKLLREKVEHLSGSAGVERMESAISGTRTKFFESHKGGSSDLTPPAHILSSTPISADDHFSLKRSPVLDGERSKKVVRSLFKENPGHKMGSTTFKDEGILNQANSDRSERLITENVHLVNDIVHDGHLTLPDELSGINEEDNLIKVSD